MHSLLLRLMAERSVTAFNREYHFPYLLVFADRNRVEREETFEMPAAARDRFMMEITIETPADARDPARAGVRSALPRHRRAGRAPCRRTCSTIASWPPSRAAIQNADRKRAPALERYTLDLWQAVARARSAGIDIDGVDMPRLVQGGASPRGMSLSAARRARRRLARRARHGGAGGSARGLLRDHGAPHVPRPDLRAAPRRRSSASLFTAVFETVPAP